MGILDYSDLLSFSLQGDDVQGFDTRWAEVCLSIHQVHRESLYKMRKHGSGQLKTLVGLQEQDIEHDSQPGYQKLRTIEKRCLDQLIRARNFKARNE